MTTRTLRQIWTDDYLDLLNYAISIGDTLWKDDIIHTLSNRHTHIEQMVRQVEERKPLATFESINREMMIINEQLKHSNDIQEEIRLKQKVWELKLQRMRIARQLKTG